MAEIFIAYALIGFYLELFAASVSRQANQCGLFVPSLLLIKRETKNASKK